MSVTGLDNDTTEPVAADGSAGTAAVTHGTRTAARLEALVLLALLAVLALGAYFRFAGLNWDNDSHLHPDERFLTIVGSSLSGVDNPLDYLRTSVSTLNPYNFGQSFYVYGNFPMTATRYAAEWVAGACDALTRQGGEPFCDYTYTGYDGIQLVGRALSALVDLFSVLLTFLMARRLYNWRAGLFAAFLLAVAVMPIQQSHFFTMDNWATAATTLALYAAVRAATLGDDAPRWRLRWYALFGLALGLAAASRVNMAPLAVIVNVSAVIWMARRASWGAERQGNEDAGAVDGRSWLSVASRNQDLERALIGVALAAMVAIFTFRLANPYAFSDAQMVREQAIAETGQPAGAFTVALKSVIGLNPQFLANMAEIQRLQAPEASFPPAVQWVDRPAILFPLGNMVLYGMGLTAGLFAWFAAFWALWRCFQQGRRATDDALHRDRPWRHPEWMLHAIPLSWTLLYFLFMGTRWVKSVRYFLPVYPALFVLAGWAVAYLWWRAGRTANRGRSIAADRVTDGGPPTAGGRRP